MNGQRRTLINVATFLLASLALAYYGATNLIVQQASGMHLAAEFSDASGIAERNDVTMRGVVVGSVTGVELTETGVMVDMRLNPGEDVPEGTEAMIVRRSPIGELTIELEPGDGEDLASGSTLPLADTQPPPDVSTTIEALADVLHAVPSEDLETVVSELSDAVRGRSEDLARFTDASAALPERLLEIESELESLITTGPELTGVFADNAEVFADDLRQTAVLADILRDRRYDLLNLYKDGARFSAVANDLLVAQKANLACFIRDAGTFNLAIAARRGDLEATLQKNHFFFDAVEQAVQKDPTGGTWFRVQLLPHQEPAGNVYAKRRKTPDVFPGRGCNSIYGKGVPAATDGNTVLAPRSAIRK
jgi:phospholipid/cholesterol/gamma-HCH transport system substrate-binding protein